MGLTTVFKDEEGNLAIELPEWACETLELIPGSEIIWYKNDSGDWTIFKKDIKKVLDK